MTVVTSPGNEILGIITDGDLRRMLEKDTSLTGVVAADIMTQNPRTVSPELLAMDALDILRRFDINQLVVAEGTRYLGVLHLHDLIREGLH